MDSESPLHPFLITKPFRLHSYSEDFTIQVILEFKTHLRIQYEAVIKRQLDRVTYLSLPFMKRYTKQSAAAV